MKFTITHRYTNNIIFEIEAESFRQALETKIREGADLQGADLHGAYLQGTDLRCANLQDAYLQGANLRCVNLQGADLRDAYLHGADLQGTDLRCANLRCANLQGADLRCANLQGADLHGAYLHGADLQGTDLQGADLHGAYLQGTDLRCANLQDAYLQGADLRCANLHGAYLREWLISNSVHDLLTTIDWGVLPADLTLEMMRHDAESCGMEAMQNWADGGVCPFNESVRDYLFAENIAIWVPGEPSLRGIKLLEALWVTKGGKLTKEEPTNETH